MPEFMDNIFRDRRHAAESIKRKPVSYSLEGRLQKGVPKWALWVLGFAAFFFLLGAVVYVPPLFYKEADSNTYVPIPADTTAIKLYQTYLKDHPDDDFDQDGLSNSLENEHGTDVWDIDTDGDGVSDYAELFLSETSPVDATAVMVEQVSQEDERNGNTLGTPYKIDDIIFWPDTYQAKAYGAVVRTLSGYRFCNYTGWVKFPQKVYAYGYKDGVHYELTYRPNEDAWRIESDDEILLYEQPLTFINCLKLPFIKEIHLADNAFGGFLEGILPEHGGPVTCFREALPDTEDKNGQSVTAVLKNPKVDRSDPARLTRNMNTLKDLSWVRKVVEAGECLAVSMYSANAGESVGIVYGYTADGSLLVADEALNPVGEIRVTECAKRMMDKDGISWFEWKGLGFDSKVYGDRINFFASTMTGEYGQESETPASGGTDVETEAEEETNVQETEAQEEEAQETPVMEEFTEEPVTEAPETEPAEDSTVTESETEPQVITFGF